MKPVFRTLAIAVALGAAATAFAQAPKASSPAGSNPAARGDNVFYYAPLSGQARSNTIGNPLSNLGIGRPNPRNHAQVTPVPEPSQWALMAAGIALVGFIVRRRSKRT